MMALGFRVKKGIDLAQVSIPQASAFAQSGHLASKWELLLSLFVGKA